MAGDAGTMHTESEQKIVRVAKKLTIKWRIDKFESKMETALDLKSEGVSSELAPRAVWEVLAKIMSGFPYVYLNMSGPMADSKETLEVTYRLYLVGEAEGELDSICRNTYKFKAYSYCSGNSVSHERLKKALHTDGSLVVAADIEFLPPHSNGPMAIDESDLFTKWLDSVGKLHENGAYSDCTLVVGGEQLKAHRSILAAISPIFGKMFGNECFREARDGIVRIEDPPGMLKDTSAKPYKALLSYAYSGCVDWSVYSECKQDVLVLACKYLALDLKRHVERLLVNEITIDSCIDMTLLADTYSCEILKKECDKYFCSNYGAVVLTNQWDALMKSRVEMASELLQLVRESKTPASAGGGTK